MYTNRITSKVSLQWRLGVVGAFVLSLCTCNNLTHLHKPSSAQNKDSLLLTLPYKTIVTNSEKNDPRLPLIVALHGLELWHTGGYDKNFSRIKRFQRVLSHPTACFPSACKAVPLGMPMQFHRGPATRSLPNMNYAADKLALFISGLMKAYPEAGAPIVTGYSQGGMLTYALTANYPHLVSNAIPVAGFMPATILPRQSNALGPLS